MTLTIQTPKVEFTADGVRTVFPFDFTIQDDAQLVVTVDEIQQTDGIEYNLDNVTELGGDVVFVVAPVNLAIVLLSRETPLDQQIDYVPFGPFPSETHESALDKLTAIVQELKGDIQAGNPNNPNLVQSVFTRIGNVIALAGDYVASQIDYTNAFSGLTAANVQDAIDEIDGVLDAHTADDNIDDGGVRHHNQTHLLYGADHTDVDTSAALEDGSTLVYAQTAGKWFGLNVMVAAGYGGVFQDTPVGIPDLGAGFEVLPADVGTITTSRAVTQDFANNGVRFNIEGIWNVGIVFSLLHDESNSGRSIVVQLYNDTQAGSAFSVVLPIARNQPGTYFSLSFLAEILPAAIGDLFQVRIGGGDTVTGVIVQIFAINVNHASEWKAA